MTRIMINNLDNAHAVIQGEVGKFCNPGNMLGSDGECNSTVTATARVARIWFREYLLSHRSSIHSCTMKCLVHGSETRIMMTEHEVKLDITVASKQVSLDICNRCQTR